MEEFKGLPVSIVVPVKNEELNIIVFLNRLLVEVSPPFEIIIVFDEAEDKTPEHVRNFFNLDLQNIKLIRNDSKPGFFGAIKKGIEASAFEHVVVTMADGSDRAADIDQLRRSSMQNTSDIVCASRFSGPQNRTLRFPLKQQLSKTASRILGSLTAIPTRDITNNFKLYRKALFAKIDLAPESSFEWSMEFTVKAYLDNCRISEIETVWSDRQHGKSNFNLLKLLPKYTYWFGFLIFRKWTSAIIGFFQKP